MQDIFTLSGKWRCFTFNEFIPLKCWRRKVKQCPVSIRRTCWVNYGLVRWRVMNRCIGHWVPVGYGMILLRMMRFLHVNWYPKIVTESVARDRLLGSSGTFDHQHSIWDRRVTSEIAKNCKKSALIDLNRVVQAAGPGVTLALEEGHIFLLWPTEFLKIQWLIRRVEWEISQKKN